jgi:hypothetical protein
LLSARHISEVTALSPWAANADPAAWKGRWEDPPAPPESPAARASWMIRGSRSPIDYTDQLASRRDLTVFAGHSDDDTIVPAAHTQAMLDALREGGVETIRFEQFTGEGHHPPKMYRRRMDWMLQHAPRSEPTTVEATIHPLRFVPVAADAPRVAVTDPLQPATVRYRNGTWLGATNAQPFTGNGPHKSIYAGPAGNAFTDAFALCLPVQAPAHLQRAADGFSQWWQQRYGHTPRIVTADIGFGVFDDAGIDRGRRTLVVLGSPNENPAVAAALNGVDVTVAEDAVTLHGRRFVGTDVGLIYLRPDPAEPTRATLVVWGATPAAYRQLWRRFGHAVDWEGDRGWWWFDYVVFDNRTMGPETFLAVGYFDAEWTFDEDLLFAGSAERRAVSGRNWPTGEAPAAGDVWLSLLEPTAAVSSRGAVVFDGAAGVDGGRLRIQGQDFDQGIGMVPPSETTWRIDGRYRRFTATVGLHRTGDRFTTRYQTERVKFEVLGDGTLLASSPTLHATSGLVELSADVSGVERLTLRAVPQHRHWWHFGPVGWGNARLER